MSALEEQRRHIDADIDDLRRIISRHAENANVSSGEHQRDKPSGRNGRPAGSGVARQEIIDLLSDGRQWTAPEIAEKRGTSANAARAVLRRMLDEPVPVIKKPKPGYYKLLLDQKPTGPESRTAKPVDPAEQ